MPEALSFYFSHQALSEIHSKSDTFSLALSIHISLILFTTSKQTEEYRTYSTPQLGKAILEQLDHLSRSPPLPTLLSSRDLAFLRQRGVRGHVGDEAVVGGCPGGGEGGAGGEADGNLLLANGADVVGVGILVGGQFFLVSCCEG